MLYEVNFQIFYFATLYKKKKKHAFISKDMNLSFPALKGLNNVQKLKYFVFSDSEPSIFLMVFAFTNVSQSIDDNDRQT